MVMRSLYSLLLAVVLLSVVAHAKVAKDKVKGGEFAYLNKFCYDTAGAPNNGTLTYNIQTSSSTMELLLFDDEYGNWSTVYHAKGMSCNDRRAMAKGYVGITNDQTTTIEFYDHIRQHFWYFAAQDCGNSVSLEYTMTMLQPQDDKWTRQFSFDEQGLEGLYLFYFLLYFIGGCVHAYAVWTFLRSRAYHPVIRLLTIAVGLEFLSTFCLLIHYGVYSSNGVGAPGLKGIGELLDIAMQVVLILLLVLIAKGWCITKSQIEDRMIVLIGVGVLTVLYIVMFIWYNVFTDPAASLYIYETVPGIVILIVRFIAMLWFIWSLRSTYLEENHPAKREFYIWFGVAFSVWLLTLPLITIIATGVAPWWRQKTVIGMYVTMNALGLGGLSFLLWPSRAGEYFQISNRLDLAGTIPYDAI